MEGPIHIYCINLKHRADRWQRFSEQPELQTLTRSYGFERFEAINGSAIDIQGDQRISLRTKRNIKEHIRRDHEELDSAGGVGCYLSHTSVWKKFLERSEPYAIIFEDDAIIPLGFTAELQAAMRETTLLPQQPDVWFFSMPCGWYYNYKGKPKPDSVKGQNVGPWVMNTCAAFTGYLISRRGAERLLETAFPLDMHVDLYTCLNGELGRVFTVAHREIKVKPYEMRRGDTDIQVAADCKICNIPTNFSRKGMVMVNVPILLIGLGVIFAMMSLGPGKTRGR
jgi:GR25 family glycosyltransferase involved in LPS biosynthesis